MACIATPAERGFSGSELDLALLLSQAEGGDATSPSHALIARILKEDRVATPDADLQSLLVALEPQERENASCNDISIRINRDSKGCAGFSFEYSSLKISAIMKDRRELSSMRVGDVIVAVNGRPVAGGQEYNRAARGIRNFTLTLARDTATNATVRTEAGDTTTNTTVRPKAVAKKVAAKAVAKTKAKPAPRPPRGPSAAERQAMVLDVDNMSYEELLALDDVFSPVKKPGLDGAFIKQLPLKYVCGGGGECSICLEEFCDGDAATCLPCSHMFHVGCAKEWLKLHARCPYCNLELVM